ncbi:heparan-alpha-glucosaminide N-acetyltransferase domain-containing protein [Legionella sp. PATHC038]|uniref:acyltransferase family protein n=1 Tax=Legionella sheltonii TaxID=2992041 RepID=UPI0022431CFF|nr:heparan-alpha-glucosaminide N-acetyltransferase domain-containing protein [Legionella sp. PATHC038]MCW8400306.1 heparan-alpha-glucosaminide N-acetyltransferase domain-containing protein [Legionella sp. PATHC038]
MISNPIDNHRILSLDVFRGLTMALMVLVNSLGTRVSYPILMHAEWNGCSLADLVFPAFLFIVGITTVISLKKNINEASNAQLYRSILTRTFLLIFFGLFLSVFPKIINLSTIRYYGILQRIALCYFICSVLYLRTSIRTQIIIFFGIIIGYWFFLTQIPFPGSGTDQLSMENNWGACIDSQIFSPAHLLFKTFDPEGLLSTIPSVATTLSGLLTGHFLLTRISKQKKSAILIAVGLLSLLIAWIWSYSFPINKNLWTSTFILWSSGFSLIVFGLCFFVIDVLGYTKWSIPFKIFGMNALFIFIFHVVLLKIQSMFVFHLPDGSQDVLRVVIAEYLFGTFSQENAGLFYAIVFLFLNFLVAAFLYRRKIFIKI